MFIKWLGFRPILRNTEGTGGGGGTGDGGQTTTTTTAPPPSVSAPWAGNDAWQVGPEGAKVPWATLIDDADARATVEAKGYKNPAELSRAYHNLMQMQRTDRVEVPGKEATPEQLNEFYGKVGRPETPDGYEFKFADGVTPDDNMVKFARDTFHAAGLSPRQAQLVAEKWNEFAAQADTHMTEANQTKNDGEIAELQTRMGADLNKNMEAGRRAVQALGLSDELIGRIEGSIGSAPIVELLAMIGRKSEEGGFMAAGSGGGDPSNPENMTPQQAQSKINELQSDAGFMAKYTEKHHPEHAQAVDRMMKLYARL